MNDQHLAFDPARAHDYELTVQVGDPTAPDGLTRVRLDGTGRLVAEQIFEEGHPAEKRPRGRQVTGELPREEAKDLMRRASQFPWEREFPSRSGIPDEAIVVWHFHQKNKEGPSLKVWLREAESDPLLAPVLAALRKELGRLSQNQLYL